MANNSSIIELTAIGKIKIGLPLTSPTGKIRIKSRAAPFALGTPVASRQSIIDNTCYIEWQISYDTRDSASQGCVPEISFLRKGETKYVFELTTILYMGVKKKIFDKKGLDSLLGFCQSATQSDFIEDNVSVSREVLGEHNIKGIKFNVIQEKYPLYYLDRENYGIEIKIAHKQRAVGYQAMIYVCLPVTIWGSGIIGRRANKKEYAYFELTATENNFIFDTLKVFALASKQHNEDITNILRAILNKFKD